MRLVVSSPEAARQVAEVLRRRFASAEQRGRPVEALYEATEGNRLLGVRGTRLRDDLRIPQQDLAAACAYLAGEGLVTVDWEQGNTPGMVTLTNGDEDRETPDARNGAPGIA